MFTQPLPVNTGANTVGGHSGRMTLDLVDVPRAALAQNTLFSRDNALHANPSRSARIARPRVDLDRWLVSDDNMPVSLNHLRLVAAAHCELQDLG